MWRTASSDSDRSARRWLLPLILIVAAALRFTGLSAGLRHFPHEDERYFVENVGWMLARGDLDHRFHEYPGLLFLVLAPVLVFFGPPELGADAYVAARAVVAAFSVLSVALVYLLAKSLAGRFAGLAAAALLAVSPIDVEVAHGVRPDAVLGCLALVALLALARHEPTHYDLLAGFAIGMAVAVKFSGVLLAPAYLVARLARPGFGWRPLAKAAGAALLAFALLSPGSLLRFEQLLEGIWVQLDYHYGQRGRGTEGFLAQAATYLLRVSRGFGLAALALIVCGVGLAAREWRRFGPSLAFAVSLLIVFSTAEIQRQRFLAPITGVLALLAGIALAALTRRRALGLAAAAVALFAPLLTSIDYVRGISAPSTRDLALDWIEAWMPEGSRILTTEPRLGIDSSRYEVLTIEALNERTHLKALHWDLLVAQGQTLPKPFDGWKVLHVARPSSVHSGEPIALVAPRPEQRPVYEPIDPASFRLSASENEHLLPSVLDPALTTYWISSAPQRGTAWLQVDFKRPTPVGRIELALGRPRNYAAALELLVTEDGASWKRVPGLRGRPPAPAQHRKSGVSQVRVLEGAPILGLRIQQRGFRTRPWQVSVLRLEARRDVPAAPREAAVAAGQP